MSFSDRMLICVRLLVVPPTAYSTILYVLADYATIQQAIDVSRDGDSIIVAPSTYTGAGNTNIDFKGKQVAS